VKVLEVLRPNDVDRFAGSSESTLEGDDGKTAVEQARVRCEWVERGIVTNADARSFFFFFGMAGAE